ncbi:MAG: ATP-binding cassette domain-containing protein [Propionibacteriaceae bacterium]|nr:ATP-binding cassette domain-containing protein [Propionibacteriaceae bacterium]
MGRRGEITALRSATGEVHRGEFVAITGVSGSGKTTLLSILGILAGFSGGRYVVDGAGLSARVRAASRRGPAGGGS